MSFVAVFLASLIGSPHCAGMCGGFVAFYAGSSSSSFWPHVAYNLGRLVTYLLIGVAAAYVGKAVDLQGELLGVSRLMAIITGLLLLFWGVRMLLNGNTSPSTPHQKGIAYSLVRPLYRFVLQKDSTTPPTPKAFLLGLLSTTLPCGWLYSFVAIAAASADPLSAALIMSAFWLGTLPALVSLGAVAQFASASLKQLMPRVTAALLMIGGIASIGIHTGFLPHSHEHNSPHQHGAHHHVADHHEAHAHEALDDGALASSTSQQSAVTGSSQDHSHHHHSH